ncbi:MAG TPA: hypothetical protein VMW69_07570 [Spirochaetia bacterium]|nr:hypothetical protein [Spirochaetia bacterium]
MNLRTALRLARGRRLRPGGYRTVAGGIVAFLFLVVSIRLGANIYIAQQIGGPASSHFGTASFISGLSSLRFLGAANLSWCALFVAAVGPVVTYRGILRTVWNRRFQFLPVRSTQLVRSAVVVSLLSVPVYGAVLIGLLQALLISFSGGPFVMLDFLLFLVIGLGGFLAVFLLAWRLKVGESFLELIEIGLLGLMIVANPEMRMDGGRGVMLLFGQRALVQGFVAGPLLIPSAGILLSSVAILTSKLIEARGGKPPKAGRSVGLVLYRSRIPMGLFLVTYAVELPAILGNPELRTTVRNLVLIMLAIRLFWLVSFLFRTEQAIGEVIRAPGRLAGRRLVYAKPVLLHLALCLVPVVIYLVRLYG